MSAVERHEIEAAVKARNELGVEYEDAVVDSLVAKIEARLAERERALKTRRRQGARPHQIPIVLGSLGIAIPLLGIAGGTAGLAGVIAVCVAVVLVNLLALGRD